MTLASWIGFGISAAVLAAAIPLLGSDLPPWRDADDLPLPDGAASVEVLRDDVAVFGEPRADAARRGTAAPGWRLPLFGAKRGSGCAARWLSVGPMAWICQDAVRALADPPDPAVRADAAPFGLPFRYYFVGAAGSTGYARLEDAEEVAPDREFEPGFAIAVVDEKLKGGQHYLRTHHGLWVPARDVVPLAPLAFHGEEIASRTLDFGWVVEERAPVSGSPAKGGPKSGGTRTKTRFERVNILEERRDKAGVYYRVGDVEWVRARDVRRPTQAPPPESLRPGERWIDVELATQTLVAYEGTRPVFATLVSTGRGKEGTDTATAKGEFRIWVKLQSSNMDNLEDEEANRYYAIEDVPYVQYFSKGIGLHGAFWHRAFGHVRSHGCVNLAPLDAYRLFIFTSPKLPAGWTASLPTPIEEGTLVRVR